MDTSARPLPEDAESLSAYRAALAMATATLAAYDGRTASHSDDVVTLCLALGEELGVEGREGVYLLAAAELHDIGKVAVPSEIISKPAALDASEWEIVREHPVTGERILAAVPELASVAGIVRHCHERWDGCGYPDGVQGEDIPRAARIVFCADAFHAVRDDRPYRRGRSAHAALKEIKAHSGTQFDPTVVAALERVASRLREQTRFRPTAMFATPRSQRLAALLMTMAIGGSVLAATGIFGPERGSAGERPASQRPEPRPAAPTSSATPPRPEDGRPAGAPRGPAGPAPRGDRGAGRREVGQVERAARPGRRAAVRDPSQPHARGPGSAPVAVPTPRPADRRAESQRPAAPQAPAAPQRPVAPPPAEPVLPIAPLVTEQEHRPGRRLGLERGLGHEIGTGKHLGHDHDD